MDLLNRRIDYRKNEKQISFKLPYLNFLIIISFIAFFSFIGFLNSNLPHNTMETIGGMFWISLCVLLFFVNYTSKYNNLFIKSQELFHSDPLSAISIINKISKNIFYRKRSYKELLYMYYITGYIEDAKSISKKMRVKKKDIKTNLCLSYIAQIEEDWDLSIKLFESVTKYVKNAEIYASIAISNYNISDYVNAELNLLKALELDENYFIAFYYLGNILVESGKISEAIIYYKQLIQYEEQIENDDIINEIKQFILANEDFQEDEIHNY